MRDIVSPLDGFLSPFGANRNPLAAYAANGFTPKLVIDPVNGVYAYGGRKRSSFSDVVDHSATSTLTVVDSDGVLKWGPHNLLTYSEDFSNAAWNKSGVTVSANAATAPDGTTTADKIVETATNAGHMIQKLGAFLVGITREAKVWVKAAERTRVCVSVASSGGLGAASYVCVDLTDGTILSQIGGGGSVLSAGNGWYLISLDELVVSPASDRLCIGILEDSQTAPSAYLGDGTSGIYVWGAHGYRSDLGGMLDNPERGDSYVPTTSAAVYMPRLASHVYSGGQWVNKGLRLESAAATQLLHGTDAFATQTETVTAQAYTLQFRGTGSIALTGAHTATLNGTGANDLVSLTFTPSAGTLTLTPSGTVTYPQLETGSTPSSYIPNAAGSGTATRNAETATIAAAKLPYSATAMSIAMSGTMTGASSTLARWYADANNYITMSSGASDFTFAQAASGTADSVTGGSYTSGVNTAYSLAMRNGSTFINGADDGTALTADTTPVALPDLSATNLQLGSTFNGHISEFVMWDEDIADAGIEAASA